MITTLIIFYATGLIFLLQPVIESLLNKKKQNKQIKVYVDEMNKIAFIAPQKKANNENIEEVHQNLIYTYDEVIIVCPEVNFKGAYRKE
ncbi:hypothetical protein LDK94_06650 [Staphylococcus arlettae]|uniref:hypothetical protein n=1 Tax=Staphylococcus arlettae TaxID=29378 RepID=UPI001E3276C7|nr:hypothetical protein [Staphylococcus arlettae]MCD9055014.1 hypothetical protein [Staphylococcus arlettae]